MNKYPKICRNCIDFEVIDLCALRGRCHLTGCKRYAEDRCSQFALHPRFEFGEHDTNDVQSSLKPCPCCGQKVVSGVSVENDGKFDLHITCTKCNLDKKLSATGLTSLDKLSAMLIEFINEWNNRV